MRLVVCVVALALAAVVPMHIGAQEPTDTRSYWVYEGGWFAKSKDGSWYELNELTYRKLGKASKFKEVKRTKESIELYDEERKVSICLYDDSSQVRVRPGADWEKLYTGRWKTPDSAD
ncbi:MAG: hypothetical protein EBV06_03720 [Planctomycetia bacterium]|nr:hypothetical protein [Planctomycetia bacterium]